MIQSLLRLSAWCVLHTMPRASLVKLSSTSACQNFASSVHTSNVVHFFFYIAKPACEMKKKLWSIAQGSHSHGKSWKKLLSWKVMEKSWNMKISQKVMEKSWDCLFSWLWQLSSLWLSCMLWDTIITISETMWEWESWKEANQSWKSHGILFSDFCGNPDCSLFSNGYNC